MLKTKFFLAAALILSTGACANAATFLPTSPLVQIGDDTDIFFTGSLAFDVKDNLFSVADKKSAALVTFTPGFDLQYAKDSPLAVNLKASRSFLRYNKSEYKDLEQGQDNIIGSINYETGGPLTVGLSSSYNESARNDNLANILGANNQILGATLIRQANHAHALNVGYKLTEKLSLNVGFINSYNHYLNPVKTKTTGVVEGADTYEHIEYNTNTLSEINTKSIPIDITYKTPSEKLVYGLSFKHDVSDYSAAPYFHTKQKEPVGIANPVLSVVRPAGQQKFTQDFFGLTINGEPTSSGKIHVTTRFGYFSSDVDGVSQTGASYDLKISHNLTEKFTHELNLIRNTTPSATGGTIDTDTLSYTIAYTVSEKVSVNFHAIKSKAVTGATQVDTLDFNAGVSWDYNKYLKFDAMVDVLDSKVKNSPSADFKANSFNLSSTFRY